MVDIWLKRHSAHVVLPCEVVGYAELGPPSERKRSWMVAPSEKDERWRLQDVERIERPVETEWLVF